MRLQKWMTVLRLVISALPPRPCNRQPLRKGLFLISLSFLQMEQAMRVLIHWLPQNRLSSAEFGSTLLGLVQPIIIPSWIAAINFRVRILLGVADLTSSVGEVGASVET